MNQSSSVLLEKYGNKVDVVVEVCGSPSVVPEGVALLRPGGRYIFVGMVHPDSHLDITAEQLIRKCLTIKGRSEGRFDHLAIKKALLILRNVISPLTLMLLVANLANTK